MATLNQNTKESNIEFNYTYTESVLKARTENLNKLDARLGAFLAFGGITLRLSADIPGSLSESTIAGFCNPCLLLKVAVFVFVVSSLWICATGLTSNIFGTIVRPRKLMSDEWFDKETIYCKAFVINTWIVATEELEQKILWKAQKLNQVIWLLTIAIVALAIDILLDVFFITPL